MTNILFKKPLKITQILQEASLIELKPHGMFWRTTSQRYFAVSYVFRCGAPLSLYNKCVELKLVRGGGKNYFGLRAGSDFSPPGHDICPPLGILLSIFSLYIVKMAKSSGGNFPLSPPSSSTPMVTCSNIQYISGVVSAGATRLNA